MRLKWWLEGMLGVFYPPVCQCCHAETARAWGGYVGRRCRRGVRAIRPPFCGRCGLPFTGAMEGWFTCSNCAGLDLGFDWARAAVEAGGVVLEVIHRYKYDRAMWFEPFLGRLLVGGGMRWCRFRCTR
jgi:competence protein ComFC